MFPDLALEPSPAAQKANYKVDLDNNRYASGFAVYQKRYHLWFIPYWHRVIGNRENVRSAEQWLRDNWRHPSYFKLDKAPK